MVRIADARSALPANRDKVAADYKHLQADFVDDARKFEPPPDRDVLDGSLRRLQADRCFRAEIVHEEIAKLTLLWW